MLLDVENLLLPISDDEPLGRSLRYTDAYSVLQALTRVPEKTRWAEVFETAMSLSRTGHDLRVWVWLARASLVTEGVPGLAAGLALLARGLEIYWPDLPPVNSNAKDAAARFKGRINSLAILGVTSFEANLEQVTGSGTTIAVLRADLDASIARNADNDILRAAVTDAKLAMQRIENAFDRGFKTVDEIADPQISFEVIRGRFADWESKASQNTPQQTLLQSDLPPALSVEEPIERNASDNTDADFVESNTTIKWVARTREDVERIFDLVLDYYRHYEPSSPVPLLVTRAKRLVRLSFVEAIKDLAPTGLKELQIAAGCAGED